MADVQWEDDGPEKTTAPQVGPAAQAPSVQWEEDSTPPPPPSFMDRMNRSVKDYALSAGEDLDKQAIAGTINPFSYAMQKTGRAGSAIGSGVYNAVTAIPRATWALATLGDKTTTPPELTNAANAVGDYASGVIQKGGNYINNLGMGDNYTGPSMAQLAKQDYYSIPEEGRKDIESLPGMLGTMVPAATLTDTLTAAKPFIDEAAAAKKPGFIANAMASPEEHAQNFWDNRVTPDQSNHIAMIKYAEADRSGAMLKPELNDKFAEAARSSLLDNKGKYDFKPTGVVKDVLDQIGNHAGTPLTLKDAQQLEEFINSRISYQPNGFLTPESNDLLKIKKTLRDTLHGASEGDLVDPAGWQSWKDAKKAYSARGILTDIKNMIDKSAHADQPASQLKRNIARWSNKKANIAGLNPDEMDLVKDSIKHDFAHELLRTGSSRLVGIGSTALGVGTGHGLIGGVIGTGTAGIGRNLGFAHQLGKMGSLVDAIGDRLPDMTRETTVPSRAIVPAGPVVNHMTDEQIAHAQARLRATGRVTNPYSGGPVNPPVQQGFATTDPFGYNNPNPNGLEPPDLMKDFFKNKSSGGSVKGKLGFKLKSKDK